jgi:predicted amidohydrolase
MMGQATVATHHDGSTWRVAVVTGELDWSLRQRCSGAAYSETVAHAWIGDYLARQLARLEAAANEGARLMVAQEYFAGTELFTAPPAARLALVAYWQPRVLAALQALADRRQVTVVCAMECLHGDQPVETGVIAQPGGGVPWLQIKQTALPPGHPLARGYQLQPVAELKTGLFVCSDLTSFPEDPVALAKAGMEVLFCPGCGFAGPHWEAFIQTRAIDLGVPILHADDHRALVVDHLGRTILRGTAAAAVLVGDLVMPVRQPVARLYSYVGRRFTGG